MTETTIEWKKNSVPLGTVRRSRETKSAERKRLVIGSYTTTKIIEYYSIFKDETCLSFITFNPYKKSKKFARLQRIGSVHDWLRKHSVKFLLVQETNEDGTKHYHALVKGFDNKVMRDMQTRVDPVGKSGSSLIHIPATSILGPPTVADRTNWFYQDAYEDCLCRFVFPMVAEKFARWLTSLWNKQRLLRNKSKRDQSRLNKNDDVGRILNYMSKETTYTQYTDYTVHNLG